ncbi:MAG: hypothetical protein U9Q74_16625 [Gemmatimonadota bacterium]|nr:hypothetical protein [Gemmatimonadota bacterium]
MSTSRARVARRALIAVAAASVLAACADKGFTPPAGRFSPKITLQISTYASQQLGFGPKYVLLAALYQVSRQNRDDDFVPLAFKYVPVGNGQLNVTLPVDISPCLADDSRLGAKDGCTMYLAAVLMPDTVSLADTSSADPLSTAFDYAFPIGPFVVGAAKAPTIPPIDLSATRFGVVNWQQDDALRLASRNAPWNLSGSLSGAPTATGATLMLPTAGVDYSSLGQNQFAGFYPTIAIFENGGWRRVVARTLQGGPEFAGIAALSTTEAYLAHQAGLFTFDGTNITRVGTVNDPLASVAAVTSGSAKWVAAGTVNGAVWIGNTQSWQRYTLGTSARIDAVCITGQNEAFAASSTSGQIFRFNGSVWTSVSAPLATVPKYHLQCPAAGQAFVIASGSALYQWNGSTWVALPLTGIGPARIVTFDWAVVSPTEIYAVSDSSRTDRVFYRFDGTKWNELGRERFNQAFSQPWADPRGGAAYAVSLFGRVEKMTTSGASVLAYQPNLRDVVMTSASSAFAVGWNMFLARWDGAQWTVDPPPAGTRNTRALQGVWSDGPKNAWAVGARSVALKFDGTAWAVVSDSLRPLGAQDNYNAVWGSASDVWIVGDATIVQCKGGTSCGSQPSPAASAGALYSVWGSAANNIFAVGVGGRILKYDGTAWATMASPTNRTLARVAGSGPTDVWALGDSVLLHYDGTQWSVVGRGNGDFADLLSHVPTVAEQQPGSSRPDYQGLFQLGLWVRSPKEVYVGSEFGNIVRYDGTSWHNMTSGSRFWRRVTGISGTPGGCALAVTDAQTDFPSSQLWRGAGPSGCLVAPMTGPKVWP